MLALNLESNGETADLTVVKGRYLDRGFDLQTAAHLTVYCDAPALAGDAVPEGRNPHGWWAQEYLEGEIWGSRWWLLENAQATTETLRRAEEYLIEAFDRWVVRGWASEIIVGEAEYVTGGGGTLLLSCTTTIVAPDGATESFVAWQEVAV